MGFFVFGGVCYYNRRMEKEIIKTIGFVLFRKNGKDIRYLLLHHHGPYWNFPKGRVEEHEKKDELETAFRETEEETGIPRGKIRMCKGFRQNFLYNFTSKYEEDYGEKVVKRAIFYVGESLTDEVVISDEHKDFGWFSYEEAVKKLHFKNGQEVLKRAHGFIIRQSHRALKK